MKKPRFMKRLLAAFLAGATAVVLSVTAYAADPGSTQTEVKGSITIDNPAADTTYSLYKIFDVSYAGSGSAKSYSYSIDSNSAWITVVSAYANDSSNGLTLTGSEETGKYVVSITESAFSAADFAEYLGSNTGAISADATLGPVTEGQTSLTKENLDLGYYFVTTGKTDALCNLTTTDPSATIHDKNDVPFEKTVAKDTDNSAPETDGVQVGQKLSYTITGSVPDTSGFETYIYQAKDTMDKGLTFNEDVTVTIGGTSVTLATVTGTDDLSDDQIRYIAPVTDAGSETGGGFELRLDLTDKTYGDAIVITYTATVNDAAVNAISANEAILEYGNDPSDLTESTPQVVKVFSSRIVIDKYKYNANDKEDKSTKLSGAKFVLRNAEGKYYKGTFSTDTPSVLTRVEWIDAAADGKVPTDATVVTTDTTGAASFEGLKNGTYELVETVAPDGYNLLTDPINVTVNASITGTGTSETLVNAEATASVANKSGSFLPSTGGIGTTIFYVIGLALIVAAIVLLIVRRRADSGKN